MMGWQYIPFKHTQAHIQHLPANQENAKNKSFSLSFCIPKQKLQSERQLKGTGSFAFTAAWANLAETLTYSSSSLLRSCY